MSASSEFFERRFSVNPVMAILRGFDPDETVRLCNLAADLGIELIEVPVQDDRGARSLAAAIEWGSANGLLIGAGTVTSVDLLTRVRAIGAAFTVAPGVRRDVIEQSGHIEVPHLPGVATATEVQSALALGCMWQKAFPASVLGREWITAMLGPFPEVKFVATGGITAINGTEYLGAGAQGVSLGSSFADATPQAIQSMRLQSTGDDNAPASQ